MSWTEIKDRTEALAIQVTWQQWAQLGSSARASGDVVPWRIIDPECLVLLSLAFRERERRLEDLVRWWARSGSSLTSVQRMRTLSEAFGDVAEAQFGLFARWAAEFGHRSWDRYAAGGAEEEGGPTREPKGPDELGLIEPSTLMLRLRAAFGVGARADVLAVLIGLHGGMVSVSVISEALKYTETAVRGAVKDMARARLIQETTSRPALYSTRYAPWVDLLELRGPWKDAVEGPTWGMWSGIFGFLLGIDALADNVLQEGMSEYVASSHARDLLERFMYAFNFHGIPVPRRDAFPGKDFLGLIDRVLNAVEGWLTQPSQLSGQVTS